MQDSQGREGPWLSWSRAEPLGGAEGVNWDGKGWTVVPSSLEYPSAGPEAGFGANWVPQGLL